jgi:hypothetical protein
VSGYTDGNANEGVFAMDPQATLWELARQLVAGQRILADLQRGAQAANAFAPGPLRRLFLAAVQLMRNVRTGPTFVAANTRAVRR